MDKLNKPALLLSFMTLAGTTQAIADTCPALNLQAAKEIILSSQVLAEKIHATIATTILDKGGNLLAFQKMDGTQLASLELSQLKARSALYFESTTDEQQQQLKEKGYLAHFPDMTPNGGGSPLYCGQNVIGSIGISGGQGPQDATLVNDTVSRSQFSKR